MGVVWCSSVGALVEHLTELFTPFAASHNLKFVSFGKNISSSCHSSSSLEDATTVGTLEISDAFESALEPAPISPTDSAAYKLLSGTVLETYRSSKVNFNKGKGKGKNGEGEKKKMIVAPSVTGGNTGS